MASILVPSIYLEDRTGDQWWAIKGRTCNFPEEIKSRVDATRGSTASYKNEGVPEAI